MGYRRDDGDVPRRFGLALDNSIRRIGRKSGCRIPA
jgi:hypothetical protein